MAAQPQLPPPNGSKSGLLDRMIGGMFVKTLRTAISTIKPGDWMSALQPLPPWMPMLFGRQWDFPVGRNINYQPRGHDPVSFKMLRNLAQHSEIVRLAIETRKDQLTAQPWQIRGKDGEEINENDPRIKKWTKFFKKPDGETKWADWYRMLLEEQFVTDAVTIWKQRNRGGKLGALRLLDGSTIFPLIDDNGYRPMPPDPAYQQILKGVPKGNYTSLEMTYAVRNRRVYSVYGYSCCEQVIISMKTDIERQKYSLTYFTEGSMPDAYVSMAKDVPPDQIKAFEERTNSILAGNAVGRRQMPFWPFGTEVKSLKQPLLKDEFDEWIARKICFALSIPPTPFIKAMNRANSEAQHDQAISEGQGPMMIWTRDLMNEVMAEEGDDDLEFAFVDDKELDAELQTTILTEKVGAGIITRNEARLELGLDASTDAAADELLVTTGSGLVALPGSTLDLQMQEQKLQGQIEVNQSKPAPALPAPNAAPPKKGGDKKPTAQKLLGKVVTDHDPLSFRTRARYGSYYESHEKH